MYSSPNTIRMTQDRQCSTYNVT